MNEQISNEIDRINRLAEQADIEAAEGLTVEALDLAEFWANVYSVEEGFGHAA